jgi:hypothetical protein
MERMERQKNEKERVEGLVGKIIVRYPGKQIAIRQTV